MFTFEINGVKYTKRPENTKSKGHKIPSSMYAMMMLASSYAMLDPFSPKPKEEEQISAETLIREYALIQQKKSNLSRRQRNLIEYTFNKHFVKIEDNENTESK